MSVASIGFFSSLGRFSSSIWAGVALAVEAGDLLSLPSVVVVLDSELVVESSSGHVPIGEHRRGGMMLLILVELLLKTVAPD